MGPGAFRQHFLYLRPLPQGQGSFRPAAGCALTSASRRSCIIRSGGCPANRSAAICLVSSRQWAKNLR